MDDITLPYRVFSVDPATTKSGWAMLEVTSLEPLIIRVHKHGQLDGAQLLRQAHQKEQAKIFSKQFCTVDALEAEYIRLIEEWDPHTVVSESAYAHIHISAALALTLAIHALRRATKCVLNKDIITVPPTVSKLAFTGKGSSDKDAMRAAYEVAPYLVRSGEDDEISEHEIDAIAHGCGHIARDITGTVVQISAADKRREKREKQKKNQQ